MRARPDEGDHAFPLFLLGALSGAIFMAVSLIKIRVVPAGSQEMPMSYADLAAVLLAASALVVTGLGVFVAILAIWGFASFRGIARDAAVAHVGEQLKDGGTLGPAIDRIVTAHMTQELSTGQLRKLLEARLDAAIYGGAAARAAEEEENPFGDEEKPYGDD